MQQVMSKLRRAIDDYNMIEHGEKIAVALSGGKDSALMLYALAGLSHFHPKNFSVCAVFVDTGLGNINTAKLKEMCCSLDVEFCIKKTEIGKIIFDYRKESNPCALCAKMRRGVIHDAAKEMNCKKIALGHHLDDAVETFFMNLIYESRLGCFQPVTYLSRKDVTVIRPMIYMREADVKGAVRRLGIPIMKSPCPIDGETKREEIKKLISVLTEKYPNIRQSVFGAMQRNGLDGWKLD